MSANDDDSRLNIDRPSLQLLAGLLLDRVGLKITPDGYYGLRLALVAALAWAVTGRRLLCPPLRLPSVIVLGQLLATLVAFMFSSTSPEVEVSTSATRLVEQFLPVALYVSAVGLSGGQNSTYNRRGR